MPDLLLELFSEEIPARMQARAAEDLKKLVTDRLVNTGLVYEGATAYVTPRRLALAVQGVPAKQPDVKDERKGPRVGAPQGAIAGFLKAAGLASIDQAKVQPDKKGDFYVAVIEKPGRAAIDVIAEIVPEVVRGFPWPKSMRWGGGDLTWVRPLHSIVATFGPETEEPEIVHFTIGGIAAGDVTRGHRFLNPAEVKVRRLDDYVAKLHAAKVVLDPARRREIILADAKNLAFAQGFELVEDAGLLAEVAGLVEWPVVLMGSFDEAFLAIPPEVIRTTIRNNQKCFVLRRSGPSSFETRPAVAPQDEGNHGPRPVLGSPHPEEPPPIHPSLAGEGKGGGVAKDEGGLANRFILVANTEAADGGAAIIAGNERVIRARLSDAKFFYETDLKTKLEGRLPKLDEIVFHEKLGTQGERIARIERLARELAPLVGADPDKAARAAKLAKADLVSEMVGEFPELQGLMGKYYALAQGEDASVAAAIEDHYKPLGPNDRVPTDPVSVAVALADKIDTLVGFWAIDEKPTGSKDPYALRRAALGVIKLILFGALRFSLSDVIPFALKNSFEDALSNLHPVILEIRQEISETNEYKSYLEDRLQQQNLPSTLDPVPGRYITPIVFSRYDFDRWLDGGGWLAKTWDERPFGRWFLHGDQDAQLGLRITPKEEFIADLISFFADRLKVQLREQGARHDLVDAVFALEGQDDLVLIVRRVEALGKMLATENGKSLLAGVKRATNILRIEEKKDGRTYGGAPEPELYIVHEERDLAAAIAAAKQDADAAVGREDFAAAMQAISTLRPFVDAFFEKVTVNAPDAAERENRLKLLNQIREATRAVADFSKIEG